MRVRRAVVATGCAALVALVPACGSSPGRGAGRPCRARPRRRPRPPPNPRSETTAPVADPEHAVDPPGPVETPLEQADVLLVDPDGEIDDDLARRVDRLKGVTAATRLGIVQVSIENKVYNVAVVDPAEYRRFTGLQERHAPGAVGPSRRRRARRRPASRGAAAHRRRRLSAAGFGRGRPAGARRRLRAADPDRRPGRQRRVGARSWGSPPPTRCWSRRANSTPQALSKPIEADSSAPASPRRTSTSRAAAASTPRCSRAPSSSAPSPMPSASSGTASSSGGRIAPDPVWVRDHITTQVVPILGAVTCNRAIFPQLKAALGEIVTRGLADEIHPDEYAGCYYPRFIAGLHAALQPRLRPGARPQRAGQPARHRRPDQPRGGGDLQEVGLRLGRRLALHRPDALRAPRDQAPGLIGSTADVTDRRMCLPTAITAGEPI